MNNHARYRGIAATSARDVAGDSAIAASASPVAGMTLHYQRPIDLVWHIRCGGIHIAHQPYMVVDADSVPLQAVSDGPIGRIAGLGIAALGARAVDIYPRFIHIAHGPAKGRVDAPRAGRSGPVDVGGAAPVEGIIGPARLVDDGSDVETWLLCYNRTMRAKGLETHVVRLWSRERPRLECIVLAPIIGMIPVVVTEKLLGQVASQRTQPDSLITDTLTERYVK